MLVVETVLQAQGAPLVETPRGRGLVGKGADESMKFIVERTSMHCCGDVSEGLSIDVPEAHIETFHTLHAGETTEWVVDIADLDALMAFVVKYGRVVVTPRSFFLIESMPILEIYDDYRE